MTLLTKGQLVRVKAATLTDSEEEPLALFLRVRDELRDYLRQFAKWYG